MRRRLLFALTVFAAIAVLAFAVPLSLTYATSRTQELVLGRNGDADRFATIADAAVADGDPRALIEEIVRYHELYGENVLVVDARGATTVNAGVDITDPVIAAAVAGARRNLRPRPVERLTPWGESTMLVARPVGTGVQVNGAVVIEASTDRARSDIAKAWAVIGAGGVVAMAVFTMLALTLSRWVLRPLAALSDAVATLTATLPKPRTGAAAPVSIARHYGGPPEMRAVAESFDAMALAVADSVDAQRQLVADTAHAMRNPLAALAIRLDSLELDIPDTAAPIFRRASAEVDRLTALLDGLLTLAVAETPTAFDLSVHDPENHCDARQVVADRIDAWHTAFEAAGMELRAETIHHEVPAEPADRFVHADSVRVGSESVLARGHAGGLSVRGDRSPEARDDEAPQMGNVDLETAPDRDGPSTGTARTTPLAEVALPADILAQILDVPLSNSCRYAGSGAQTTVTVATEPGWVIITVRDNGTGVPREEIDKLTTRFFRGSSASAGGSGLGLPIAAALAQSRGGTLTVEPARPSGLAIILRLPSVVPA
ncbi:sensor histidine kinase [Nocardia goodfellowii]|uniref:histidine kinase n=1 Tax=Nocardia goodfellowii TaxID=882446 RepID=A0ABS4Q8F6_9NOCA|nr:HAMP domain-containing sensor histidine kinase [Nocardia goodfellowii]MBP2187374.1 signal transduction histidine kinase [Nocardia goodfellowii]